MWELLHLLSYNQIFIIQLVEGTVKVASAKEPAHLILIQIHHTHVAFIVFIILIIAARITITHSQTYLS